MEINEITDYNSEIKNIAIDLQDIHEINLHISKLIALQNDKINSIENNTDNINTNIISSNEKLLNASNYQKLYVFKKIILVSIFGSAIGIPVGFFIGIKAGIVIGASIFTAGII